MRSRLLVTLAAGAMFAAPAVARAEEGEPRGDESRVAEDEDVPILATLAGGAVSLLAVGVGTFTVARATTVDSKNAGILLAEGGLVLAPLAAHAVTREWRRGLLFSLIPATSLAATGALMLAYPNVVSVAPPAVQYSIFTALTVSVFGATLGVLDAARVGERRHAARSGALVRGVGFAPVLGGGAYGAMFSGSL